MAAALGETPAVQESMVEELRQYFRNRGQDMPSHNVKQAWLIPSAQFIPNRNGTAPGWWAERDGRSIVIMPGPPVEMQAIFREQVEPRLKELVTEEVTITRNVKTMGLGEAVGGRDHVGVLWPGEPLPRHILQGRRHPPAGDCPRGG